MKPMSLWEYAEKHSTEMSETDRKISALEAQLWETDFRNDPAWVREQNRKHNAPILAEISRLRRTANEPPES